MSNERTGEEREVQFFVYPATSYDMSWRFAYEDVLKLEFSETAPYNGFAWKHWSWWVLVVLNLVVYGIAVLTALFVNLCCPCCCCFCRMCKRRNQDSKEGAFVERPVKGAKPVGRGGRGEGQRTCRRRRDRDKYRVGGRRREHSGNGGGS